ncbi:hypothetical protein CPB83DRAFT_187932 [Crepidotus variabilis]|uniref:Uncharacterized protein n=1 Tax=Crepidotus variabilis TaxID=179855 RepID=A0A9P6JQY7_9AGAR|nr:hypothetical protein CPB83DRAFT_187932 [Crepidotus variabilis]
MDDYRLLCVTHDFPFIRLIPYVTSIEDPSILSGTLRSTLDVFDEYEDAEICEASRRVHLIPSENQLPEAADTINGNILHELDSRSRGLAIFFTRGLSFQIKDNCLCF